MTQFEKRGEEDILKISSMVRQGAVGGEMGHPLHLAVADEIESHLNGRAELVRDPACGGSQQLPLFIGQRKARDTRMCCVDLLIISALA